MLDFRPALQGVTFGRWLHLLRLNKFRIAPMFWGRALSTTAIAALNSVNAWVERQKFASVYEQIQIEKPLFVIGHWRSGTTLLHELLACDTQYITPSLYQVWNPHTFMTTEARARKMAGHMIDMDRGFDRVKVGFDAPSEDEFALWHGSGLSDFSAWTFPENATFFDRYLTLEELSDGELTEWINEFKRFLQKISVQAAGQTVLLKSPQHTARIAHLLNLFPDARFIHISRHPCDVFRSTQRLHQSMAAVSALQKNTWAESATEILDRYELMYRNYLGNRSAIPAGQLIEIRYEDLVVDYASVLHSIYDGFGLECTDSTRASVEAYKDKVGNYKTNSYGELEADLVERIHHQWGFMFEHWGYSF